MSEIVSILTKLEPVLTIAFTLNLAYLGLERFRYRKAIREYVQSKMADLQNPSDRVKSLKYYKNLARLSRLQDEGGKLLSRKGSNLPGLWGAIYAWWFECHIDVLVINVLATISAALLALGVAYELNVVTVGERFFVQDNVSLLYIAIVVMCFVPVLSVIGGRHTVKKARRFAVSEIEEISIVLQIEAQNAEILPGE
ncbi:hypothetical protein [Thalassospira lucentensis]|uniref:hypothetical protein n=1 Tax=Thalassospira lucentensis TaxID=168935 RepID=UPI003AA868DA